MAIENLEELEDVASRLKRQLRTERFDFDIIRDYVKGTTGFPKIPDNSTDEIKELRKRSIKNVMPSVVNAYSDALGVIGFATPDSEDNAPVWDKFNELNLPALQAAVHRSTVTYGVGYLSVLPGPGGALEARAGSPRNTLAWYDSIGSMFPTYALETWTDSFGVTRGMLVDELNAYPLHFDNEYTERSTLSGEPVRHGAVLDGKPVTPVIRFLNHLSADEDDAIAGDVEPLIDIQKAITEVNFTRLLVTRYGAHPMKIITNWDAPDQAAYDAVANSVDKVLAIDDDAKIHSFDPADPAAYTAVLAEMLSSVNTMSGLNPVTTGASTMTNLSAEAIALTDAIYRGRVASKQRALAGSWKAFLRVVGAMSGVEVDPTSEVLWKSLETPTMGAVGNLISQAEPAGIPIKYLVSLIPGITPQTVRNIRREMEENSVFDPETIFNDALAEAGLNSGEFE